MAARTCEGATLPDEHAAPDDTATPSRSNPITVVSAFVPGTANSVVLGSRGEDHGLRRDLFEALFEPVAQRRHLGGLFDQTQPHRLGGGAKPRDAGDVLGAGAA